METCVGDAFHVLQPGGWEKGVVVEFGSHAELSVREGGVYNALVNSQRLSFTDA